MNRLSKLLHVQMGRAAMEERARRRIRIALVNTASVKADGKYPQTYPAQEKAA